MMDQNKVIKRMQIRQQRIKLLQQKMKDVEEKKRKFDEMMRTMSKEMKSMDNLLETDHSHYLLFCLQAINLNPLADRAIILGSLAILAEKIKIGNASDEIDNAIKKYKELVEKGVVNEAAFVKEEKVAENSGEDV